MARAHHTETAKKIVADAIREREGMRKTNKRMLRRQTPRSSLRRLYSEFVLRDELIIAALRNYRVQQTYAAAKVEGVDTTKHGRKA